MSLEETLSFLLSLVGQLVEVAVESPASGLVANFSGRLAGADEMAPSPDPTAPLFFRFEDTDSAFFIAPREFKTARRSSDGESVRIEDRAGIALHVERAGNHVNP